MLARIGALEAVFCVTGDATKAPRERLHAIAQEMYGAECSATTTGWGIKQYLETLEES
jgi:hypothetical protein